MLIAEDLLLLVTDDESGKLTVNDLHVDLALGGAALVELSLSHRGGRHRRPRCRPRSLGSRPDHRGACERNNARPTHSTHRSPDPPPRLTQDSTDSPRHVARVRCDPATAEARASHMWHSGTRRGPFRSRKGPLTWISLVAGAGFEPATFGL